MGFMSTLLHFENGLCQDEHQTGAAVNEDHKADFPTIYIHNLSAYRVKRVYNARQSAEGLLSGGGA